MGKKYFKQTLEVVILSENKPLDIGLLTLEEIHNLIMFGPCSGEFWQTNCVEVTGKEMAQLLIDQTSDPEFFGLDENGNEVD